MYFPFSKMNFRKLIEPFLLYFLDNFPLRMKENYFPFFSQSLNEPKERMKKRKEKNLERKKELSIFLSQFSNPKRKKKIFICRWKMNEKPILKIHQKNSMDNLMKSVNIYGFFWII